MFHQTLKLAIEADETLVAVWIFFDGVRLRALSASVPESRIKRTG